MFIIRNISEQRYFADIKYITADSPDLRDFVTELASAEIIHATNWHCH